MDETKLQEILTQAIQQYIMDQPKDIRLEKSQSFLGCMRRAVQSIAENPITTPDPKSKYLADIGQEVNPVMQEPYLDRLYILSTPYAYTATVNYFLSRGEEVEAGLLVRDLILADLIAPQNVTATKALIHTVRRYLFPRNWLGRLAMKVMRWAA